VGIEKRRTGTGETNSAASRASRRTNAQKTNGRGEKGGQKRLRGFSRLLAEWEGESGSSRDGTGRSKEGTCLLPNVLALKKNDGEKRRDHERPKKKGGLKVGEGPS